jgi:anti-sigma B factor antagonist
MAPRYDGRGSEGGRMQIGQRMVGDVAIVEITGDITLSKGGDVIIKDKVQSLLQQGNRKLLLDLGNVSYVDSAGLGQLVQVYATTSHLGGGLKLLRVTKRLKDLLVLTKLLTVFETFDDEAEAVASFKK